MKILERYILKENFKPFLSSLVVVTFVMILDRLLDLLKIIIEKQLDAWSIIEIFGLSLPFMMALTIPMAVLLATIMSFGRLSTDNELVAFKSCGINIFSLMKPTVIAALLLSLFMLYFNDQILPESNHILKNKMIEVNYRRPATAIEPGMFNKTKDITVYVRDRIDSELYGIMIYNRENSKFPATINAEHGRIELSDGGNSMIATLYDGQMHERDDKDKDVYNIRNFKKLIMNMPDLGFKMREVDSDYRSDRELNVKAMQEIISDKRSKAIAVEAEIDSLKQELSFWEGTTEETEDKEKATKRLNNSLKIKSDKYENYEKKIRMYEVEVHKKYALAFACLIFVLIGAPVGMMTKSNGVGMAFTVSSVVFMIYYGALTGGEQLADKGIVEPWLSMWIANIVLGIIGVYLIVISVREMKIYDLNVLWKKLKSKFRRKTPHATA